MTMATNGGAAGIWLMGGGAQPSTSSSEAEASIAAPSASSSSSSTYTHHTVQQHQPNPAPYFSASNELNMNPYLLRNNANQYGLLPHAPPTNNNANSLHPGHVMMHNNGDAKSAMEEIQRLLAQQQQNKSDLTSHNVNMLPVTMSLMNNSTAHMASNQHQIDMHSMPSSAGAMSMPWMSHPRMSTDMASINHFSQYGQAGLSAPPDGMATMGSIPMLSSLNQSPLSSSMSMLPDSASSSPYPSSSMAFMGATATLAGPSTLVPPMMMTNAGKPMVATTADDARERKRSSNLVRTTPPVAALRSSTVGGSIAGTTRRAKFRRSRTGCMVCRKRKVRCDQDGVPCKQCRIGKRDCHYEDNPPKRRRRGKSALGSAKLDEASNDQGSESYSGGEDGRMSSTSSSSSRHVDSTTDARTHPVQLYGGVGEATASILTASGELSSGISTPLTVSHDDRRHPTDLSSEHWSGAGVPDMAMFNGTGSDDWVIKTPSTGPTSVHTADGDGLDSSASASRRTTLTLDGQMGVTAMSAGVMDDDERALDSLKDFTTVADPTAESTADAVKQHWSPDLLDASRYAVHPITPTNP